MGGDLLAPLDSGRDLDRYNPAEGLARIALAEASETFFARARDATKLCEAIEAKLTEQRNFVRWYDAQRKDKGGRSDDARDASSGRFLPTAHSTVSGWTGVSLAAIFGIDPTDDKGVHAAEQLVSRWRRSLSDDAAFQNVLDDACSRAVRLCEQGNSRPDPAAQRGQPNRDGPDFWPTPACLTNALVRFVLPVLPPGPIWECAAGDGRLVKAMQAAGRSVLATDLYPQDGSQSWDFLEAEPPRKALGAIAATNPPFSLLDDFIDRGLKLFDAGAISGLVLLFRHDHLIASNRVGILNRATRLVHCNWRPIWIDDSEGNPRWAFTWLAWHGGDRQPPLYVSEREVAAA